MLYLPFAFISSAATISLLFAALISPSWYYYQDKMAIGLWKTCDNTSCTNYFTNSTGFCQSETLPKAFIDNTCHELGLATLSLALVAFLCSIATLGLLSFGSLCCRSLACPVFFAGGIAGVGTIISILTCLLWLIQSDPLLQSDSSIGLGFICCASSILLSFGTMIGSFKHLQVLNFVSETIPKPSEI